MNAHNNLDRQSKSNGKGWNTSTNTSSNGSPDDSLEIICGSPGEILVSPGDTPCLFVVLSGYLDVFLPLPRNHTPSSIGIAPHLYDEDSRVRHLFQVAPGGLDELQRKFSY